MRDLVADGLLQRRVRRRVRRANLRPADTSAGAKACASTWRMTNRGGPGTTRAAWRPSNTRRAWHWRSASRRASTTSRAMRRRCRGCSTPCAGTAAAEPPLRGHQAARIWFHSATRSALAASTAAASPSIFTRLDLVALLDGVDHVHALDHLAEHGVLAVQPRVGHVGDEELAAVGVRAGVGHRQHAALVAQAVVGLVLEAVARAAAAGALAGSRPGP